MTAVIRAHQALRSAGLPEPGPNVHLIRVPGALNEVWRYGGHVLRVNPHPGSVRLQREAEVLGRLPAAVMAPAPVATGAERWGEWMVITRMPGQELSRAWGTLRTEQRRRAIAGLADLLRALHGVSAAGIGPVADCPHPLPVPQLIDALVRAGRLPGVDRAVVAAATERVEQLRGVLDDAPDTLVHGDLHLENVLTGEAGQLTGLVDFEWATAGPPDLDLDILLHSFADPSLHVEGGSAGKLQRRDFDEVVGWLRSAYPELLAHPQLAQRLWLYRLAYEVRSLLRQPPPPGVAAAALPVHHPYQRILRLLDDRSELAWFLG